MNLSPSSSSSFSDRLAQACSTLQNVRVVLSHTSHPGNIGAAARAMKTMGLSRLVLVNPKSFPHDEAIARSAGAEDILLNARVCATLDEALSGAVFALAVTARHRNLGPVSLSAREAAEKAVVHAADGDVALLFGNETSGLTNDEVQRCQRSAFIPANPEYTSLNLGAAVQVLCYELRVAAFVGEPPVVTKAVAFSSPSATSEDTERFYAHLEAVMVRTGFLDPENPRRLMAKLRRLFGRVALERDEINILRGVLDSVEKKLEER